MRLTQESKIEFHKQCEIVLKSTNVEQNLTKSGHRLKDVDNETDKENYIESQIILRKVSSKHLDFENQNGFKENWERMDRINKKLEENKKKKANSQSRIPLSQMSENIEISKQIEKSVDEGFLTVPLKSKISGMPSNSQH